MDKVRVGLWAHDPLSYAGLASYLDSASEVALVTDADPVPADVVVAVAERPSRDVLIALREPTADYGYPVVFVTEEMKIDEGELLAAVRCCVVSILPRFELTSAQLLRSVLAVAAGGGVMPPALVGELLVLVKRMQQELLGSGGPMRFGLTGREVDVLRLVADGMDTGEIADRLCYSERTVKNVIHGLTGRLKLRNRAHAVAYAFRSGLI